MVYIVQRTQKGSNGTYYTYASLCKAVRKGKKVQSIHLKYLGKIGDFKKISKKEINTLFKKYNYSCAKCGTTKDLTVDHIISKCNGGKNNFENLQALCKKCNSIKGKR